MYIESEYIGTVLIYSLFTHDGRAKIGTVLIYSFSYENE